MSEDLCGGCGAPVLHTVKTYSTTYGRSVTRRCCSECLPLYLRWQAEDDQWAAHITEHGYPPVEGRDQLVLWVERAEFTVKANTGWLPERFEPQDSPLPGMEDLRTALALRKSWLRAWDKHHSGKTNKESK